MVGAELLKQLREMVKNAMHGAELTEGLCLMMPRE